MLRFLTEQSKRRWLVKHAAEVLGAVGIVPGRTVLDFGCGAGAFTLLAAQLVGEEGTVHALDCDAKKIAALAGRAANARLDNIHTICTGGELEIPLPEEACDVVLLYDVLQHLDDWPTIFAEALRVLRPSGTLSVYPMHVDAEQVKRECAEAGLAFRGTYEGVLNFTKRDV